MANKYPLDIVTLKKTVFNDNVECLTAPGGLGYLGILAGHAPLLTNIEIGSISIKLEGKSEIRMAVGEGFLIVTGKTATLLVDTAEKKEEIDVERARSALSRARERIASHSREIDLTRAEAALKRAIARLKLAGAM